MTVADQWSSVDDGRELSSQWWNVRKKDFFQSFFVNRQRDIAAVE
jgi:hypothetical protein